MINNKQLEGKKYKFKKNSISKIKSKYNSTYQYILLKILRYKKNLSSFNKSLNINQENEKEINKLLLNVIESTAKDLKIDDSKVYSHSKFNKKLIKEVNKSRKLEKKNKNDLYLIKLYNKIDKKEYKDLRRIAKESPNDFLKAIYLYTICED